MEEKGEILSFPQRNSFVLCFWVYKKREDLRVILNSVLKDLFEIEDYELYCIQGNRENKIRIICPDIYVNSSQMLDIRNLILDRFGLKESSFFIPKDLYHFPIYPTILMSYIFDTGLNKIFRQQFTCSEHPQMTTEELEEKLQEWLFSEEELTPISEKYKQFKQLSQEPVNNNSISEEIQKKLGGYLQKCLDWFREFHPDSTLRGIKQVQNIYLFDFSKSKHECKLCKLVHLSNRQYLTFKKKKAFYHCYDDQANGKKIIKKL